MLGRVLLLAIIGIITIQTSQSRDKVWMPAKVTDSEAYAGGWVYAIQGQERFYNVVSSKPLALAIGESIHISPDGAKLHLIDGSGKEHKLDITKQWLRSAQADPPVAAQRPSGPAHSADPPAAAQRPIGPERSKRPSVIVDSVPEGAEIEVNRTPMGRTPATIFVDPGHLNIILQKTGFGAWTLSTEVTSGESASLKPELTNLSAAAEAAPAVPHGRKDPVVFYKVDPAYTEEARSAKIAGTVTVHLVVSIQGMAENITVLKGLGFGLDQRAVEAVQRWKFKPASRDGKPVPLDATIDVNFRLL